MNGDLAPRPEGGDPSRMRISDDDRHKVAEILRQAAGEGRIDLDELDERIEATYQAKTYGDLVPLTADLPATGEGPQVPVARSARSREVATPASTHASSAAIMGECTRRGPWTVPAQHTAFCLMGGVTLDLREATFEAAETHITANTIMGGIDIVVDAYTKVLVDGVPVMGEFSQGKDKVEPELGPDSPVVRVTGFALMGGVSVVRQPAPGTPKKYFGTF